MNGSSRRDRLQEIHRIAESLRAPVEAPDLTHAILDRVHAERPFLRRGTRRWVPVVRLGLGFAVLTILLGILIIQRTAPEQTTWAGRPQPLSCFMDSVGREAARLGDVQAFRNQPIVLGHKLVFTMKEQPPQQDALPAPPAAQPYIVAAVYEPAPMYVGGEASGVLYRPAMFSDAAHFDRFEPVGAYAPGAWTMPVFPVRRLDRNLLGDLAPLITGQPAGEGLTPR